MRLDTGATVIENVCSGMILVAFVVGRDDLPSVSVFLVGGCRGGCGSLAGRASGGDRPG
jgi:hypothetical protein